MIVDVHGRKVKVIFHLTTFLGQIGRPYPIEKIPLLARPDFAIKMDDHDTIVYLKSFSFIC
jgi:hypothetical protein